MATAMDKAHTLYRNTYNSIAGVDIKAVFFGVSFGNLQAISYSITREKAPVYTMGSPEVRGYARGKRAIAGNLVFVMFDDHALLDALDRAESNPGDVNGQAIDQYKFVSDFDELRPLTDAQMNNATSRNENTTKYYELNERFNTSLGIGTANFTSAKQAFNAEVVDGPNIEDNWGKAMPWYSDQIPAFNIVLTGVNEDGFAATMSILGVEILNEGYGISIDDLISEQQMTYVARAVARWKSLKTDLTTGHSFPPFLFPRNP